MDYYSILSVAQTASVAEIRKAYMKLARERHPDRFTDTDEKARAQDFFKDLTAAYNTLTNERNRADYDRSLAQPKFAAPEEMAQDAYSRGVKKFEARDFFEALELFKAAVHHVPGEARYHAALARTLAKNPKWSREAIQSAERATQLSPRTALYHLDLTEMLLSQGLKLRARKAWEAAQRLSPSDQRVLELGQELSGEGPEPPPAGPSGLRGLLRRKP